MKVIINDIDHMGRGITKIDNIITFTPKTIPEDIVNIDIIKKKKNYQEGKLLKVIEKSPNRIKTKCPYYDVCGGCHISNLSYNNQLIYKKNKVINIFKKYSDIIINPEIIPSTKEYQYRNKITYHNGEYLGLVSIDNKIINIDSCLLVSDKVNNLLKKIKKEDTKEIKELTIREFANGLVLDIKGNLFTDNLKEDVISIYKNNNLIYEKEKGYFILNNIKYYVSNNSFFQINTSNIETLYNQIIKLADFKKNDKVIDLYCGVGSITLYISKLVKEILGIEIVESAIEKAKENAKINNIKNAKFKCGAVSSLIDNFIDADKIIVDPPRSGLDKHTINVLNNSKTKKIIYVSCDPITLARDIKNLNNYELKNIVLIDMFPQTYHVESIALLKLK